MSRAFFLAIGTFVLYNHRVFFRLKDDELSFIKLWTIFYGIHISPRWGLYLGTYGVSINISPRWGYPLAHPSLFFSELRI